MLLKLEVEAPKNLVGLTILTPEYRIDCAVKSMLNG
jgi:hypothetical protein